MVTLIFFLDSRHSSITTFYLPKYAFKWTIEYASLIASWTLTHNLLYFFLLFFFSSLLSILYFFLSLVLFCTDIMLWLLLIFSFDSSQVSEHVCCWCDFPKKLFLFCFGISLLHRSHVVLDVMSAIVHDSCDWIEWNWYVNCGLSAQSIMWTKKIRKRKIEIEWAHISARLMHHLRRPKFYVALSVCALNFWSALVSNTHWLICNNPIYELA